MGNDGRESSAPPPGNDEDPPQEVRCEVCGTDQPGSSGFCDMCGHWLVGQDLDDEDPLATSPPAVFVEATAWVATAVASGVLGNAAYDALKAAYAKITRRTPLLREQTDRDVLLAQLAVAARCGELGMPVPEYSSLRCTSASASASENQIFLESTTLKATVVIPRSVDGDSDISVTLYTIGE